MLTGKKRKVPKVQQNCFVGRRDSGTVGAGAGHSHSGGNSDRDSRESSPRALWRRAGRRKSSSATLEEKLSKKKNKQQKSHSPDSSSSREPSPKFGEGKFCAAVNFP